MAGLATTLGSGAMTNSISDIVEANVLLVIGSNTTEAHPVLSLQMKKAVRQRGAKLILIDPRRIELAQFAHMHLRHNPGSDVAVINSMANVILDEGLENRGFIDERTEGLTPSKLRYGTGHRREPSGYQEFQRIRLPRLPVCMPPLVQRLSSGRWGSLNTRLVRIMSNPWPTSPCYAVR